MLISKISTRIGLIAWIHSWQYHNVSMKVHISVNTFVEKLKIERFLCRILIFHTKSILVNLKMCNVINLSHAMAPSVYTTTMVSSRCHNLCENTCWFQLQHSFINLILNFQIYGWFIHLSCINVPINPPAVYLANLLKYLHLYFINFIFKFVKTDGRPQKIETILDAIPQQWQCHSQHKW